MLLCYQPVNAISIGMKRIKAEVMLHQHEDNEAARDAERKAEHIDHCIRGVPLNGAKGDGEVIPDHRYVIMCLL